VEALCVVNVQSKSCGILQVGMFVSAITVESKSAGVLRRRAGRGQLKSPPASFRHDDHSGMSLDFSQVCYLPTGTRFN